MYFFLLLFRTLHKSRRRKSIFWLGTSRHNSFMCMWKCFVRERRKKSSAICQHSHAGREKHVWILFEREFFWQVYHFIFCDKRKTPLLDHHLVFILFSCAPSWQPPQTGRCSWDLHSFQWKHFSLEQNQAAISQPVAVAELFSSISQLPSEVYTARWPAACLKKPKNNDG